MSTALRRTARIAAALGATAAVALAGAGTASADEWPTPPPYPSPLAPFDYDGFLTPTDLDYWNPFVSANRLTSPFGTDTRVVCTGFHGVLLECWQADREGNPHKLTKLAQDYPDRSGRAARRRAGHFVYPGFVPGS
ncbi:hypothetical protein GS930_15755 [Rhodococcus hoagii]|nr:hypothetical protein [Prescottella equi]